MACFYENQSIDGTIQRWGHVIGLKIKVKENKHYSYRVIDYQLDTQHEKRCFKNKLPPMAGPPFYLFEKFNYYDFETGIVENQTDGMECDSD